MSTQAFEAGLQSRQALQAVFMSHAGGLPRPTRRADDPPRDGALPAAALALVLDEIDYGMVLLGAEGQVQHANHAARAQLATGLPLQLQGGRLVARNGRETATLHAALDNARRRGLRTLVALSTGAGQRSTVAVIPMPPAPGTDGGGALVMIGKRRMCEELTAVSFGKAHGLTPAETKVLFHLCNGDSPADAARRAGVKVSTTRTHISSIRIKLGARNLDEMMRTVALLPPLVGSLRGAVQGHAQQPM